MPVTRAVITVPAHFNDKQRRATLQAGRLAGLEVLALLNEPTAAAFAYGLNNLGQRSRVLVFDLGGGTFDVTIVDMGDREINVVGTRGDFLLGGKDWDDALIDRVAQEFVEKHGLDPRTSLVSLHDLRAKCVSAKISLSRKPRVNIIHDFAGRIVRVTVTREDFDDLTGHLLARCEQLTWEVLRDLSIGVESIDTVLLAGGSTRMPMVRDMLQRMFGRPPSTDINPDEAVALGAALTASLEAARRSGSSSPVDIRTHDVTSHSLGFAVVREGRLANAKVIPRNTRIPAEQTRSDIVTSFDGQTAVDLWLVQGDHEDPLQCTVLGHFEFYGIPPRPAGASRISVTFRYNHNAIVEVEAMDLGSGQILPFRVANDKVTLHDIAQGRTPHQVVLVVDGSGSMYGPRIAEARAAALRFAKGQLSGPHRKVAVVSCPIGVRQLPTQDEARVAHAIEGVAAIGASPLARTLQRADEAIQPEAGVGRVFVIYSDGRVDDAEELAPVAQAMRDTGAHIITVGIGRSPNAELLRSIASTPDDYFLADEEFDLGNSFANLATWSPEASKP
jgi:molecular chaperone DnaK